MYDKKLKPVSSRAKAFTMVEVLATLMLISVIIPSVMKGVSVSMRLASESRKKMQATMLAETKLSEILLGKEWQNSSLSGTFEDYKPEYRWSLISAEWIQAGVKQLQLNVSWETAGREREVSLSTLVYDAE